MTENAHPKNRRLQFSLRFLLVSTLLVAAFFAGRVSMREELLRERDRARAATATARQALQNEALRRYEFLNKPSNTEEGMMIDAIEHQKRWLRGSLRQEGPSADEFEWPQQLRE